MADGYDILAPVYDRLNRQVDYFEWADYIEKCIDRYSERKPHASVLDMGCGTGTMTLELARRGYDMTALDISEDMLAEADSLARSEGIENILFLCEDMCAFELYGTVDHIICCLDGINHITDREELLACFSLVNNYLNPGGLFIFDLNTPYKFRTMYADRDYVLEDDGAICCQRIRLSKSGDRVTFYLTVFEENSDGSWERTDGVERERAYGLRAIRNALGECGLEPVSVSEGYGFEEPSAEALRWYIVAKKPSPGGSL